MDTEILTYSRAKGVFAGLTLEGASIRQDNDSRRAIYGRNVTTQALLLGMGAAPADSESHCGYHQPCQIRMRPRRRASQKTGSCRRPSQSHACLAYHADCEASPNACVGEPSSRECRKGIHRVIERSLVHHVMHRKVLLVDKVEGKPSESEVQRARVTKGTEGRRPGESCVAHERKTGGCVRRLGS